MNMENINISENSSQINNAVNTNSNVNISIYQSEIGEEIKYDQKLK